MSVSHVSGMLLLSLINIRLSAWMFSNQFYANFVSYLICILYLVWGWVTLQGVNWYAHCVLKAMRLLFNWPLLFFVPPKMSIVLKFIITALRQLLHIHCLSVTVLRNQLMTGIKCPLYVCVPYFHQDIWSTWGDGDRIIWEPRFPHFSIPWNDAKFASESFWNIACTLFTERGPSGTSTELSDPANSTNLW